MAIPLTASVSLLTQCHLAPASDDTRDAMVYGLARRSTKNFYLHWKQRHARAATLGNARNMLAAVNALKTRVARLGVTAGA